MSRAVKAPLRHLPYGSNRPGSCVTRAAAWCMVRGASVEKTEDGPALGSGGPVGEESHRPKKLRCLLCAACYVLRRESNTTTAAAASATAVAYWIVMREMGTMLTRDSLWRDGGFSGRVGLEAGLAEMGADGGCGGGTHMRRCEFTM